ncbi:hypothetical protein AX16_009376 [Volvariella volvacea WC 439]|nr:hypothetical protein AX16_009376 [Volvariella volvacea WC 439]
MSSSVFAATTVTTVQPSPVCYDRVVRFDQECVLIPDPQPSKRARMLTKSYSLPLWKKRHSTSPAADSEANDDPTSSSPHPDDTHVVIKVPIPIFNRSPRSPSRGRTSAAPAQPLSPCLVHRTPPTSDGPTKSSGTTTRPAPTRRGSLPPPGTSPRKHASALTVPLRECCPNCVAITEECLREGDDWKEKFTRGARRRRSASLDSTANSGPGTFGGVVAVDGHSRATVSSSSSTSASTSTTTTRATTSTSPSSVLEPASPVVPPFAPGLFITVDEVDKRRKSLEHLNGTDGSGSEPGSSGTFSGCSSLQRLRKPLERDSSASSSDELNTPVDLIPPQHLPRKASPIFEEEDEDQLFPLPSPRRSPNSSPVPSGNTSPAASLNGSPAPSPNASSSCLGLATKCLLGCKNTSKDSLSRPSEGGSGCKCSAKRCKPKFLSPETAKQRTTLTSSPTPSSASSTSSLCSTSSPVTPTPFIIGSAAVPPSMVLNSRSTGSSSSLTKQQRRLQEEDQVPLLGGGEEDGDPPSPVVLHPSLQRKERRSPTPSSAVKPEMASASSGPVSILAPKPAPAPVLPPVSSSPQPQPQPPSRTSSPLIPSLRSKRSSPPLSIPIPLSTSHSRSSSVPSSSPASAAPAPASPVKTSFLSKLHIHTHGHSQSVPHAGQGQAQRSSTPSPPLVPTAPSSPTSPTRSSTFPSAGSSSPSLSRRAPSSGSGSGSGLGTVDSFGRLHHHGHQHTDSHASASSTSTATDERQPKKQGSFSLGSLPISIPTLQKSSRSKGSSIFKAGADVLRGMHAGGVGFGSP